MNDLDRELAEQLVAERWTPLVAHGVLFSLLTVLVLDHVPLREPLIWGGAIIGISTLRLILWEQARRRRLPPRTITRIARITMLALGLAWGLGGAILIGEIPIQDAALLLLGLTGLLAGGLATLVADEWTFPIYAIAMFLPLVIMVGVIGPGRFDELGVILMIIYVAFAIRLHRRSYLALRNQLHTEGELRYRERQLAAAQEIAHVGSWEWDLASNTVTWSDELRRMYGVAPDAPVSYAGVLERAHPDDRTRFEAMVAQTFATRRPVNYEWRCVRPDGGVRHIVGRNVLVVNAGGEVIRIAGTSLDVTEQRRAEEEIKVLRGILPICASCKRIRGEGGTWEAVESYVRDHSNAEFTHGLCPDCARRDWSSAAS